MQFAHLIGQGRLITYRRWHTAKQGGNLTAGLYKTEDVVDKQQNILVLFVAEIFGHGQSCQRDAHAHARRLVHLSKYQRRFVRNAAALHLSPQVVALTASFSDAGENRVTVVLHRDVVD